MTGFFGAFSKDALYRGIMGPPLEEELPTIDECVETLAMTRDPAVRAKSLRSLVDLSRLGGQVSTFALARVRARARGCRWWTVAAG